MKKTLAILLALLICVSLLSACSEKKEETPPATSPSEVSQSPSESSPEAPPPSDASPEETPASQEPEGPAAYQGELMMATTTSTDNTGLLDFLAPLFLEDTGWELKWTAVGTGEALQLGMDGEVDIVLVHSKAREETFVAEGYGVERFQVMYNDYVIVGPADGTIAYTSDVEAVFKAILDDSLVFISRGDDSGTHTKELSVWTALGLEGDSNPNYVSAGAGMGATIVMADEMVGYTLADRGTWLSTKKNADNGIELEIICEGDKNLLNQYGVIAVSPDMYPDVNNAAASAFIEWICSAEIQAVIAGFGVAEFGESLFTPNAVA